MICKAMTGTHDLQSNSEDEEDLQPAKRRQGRGSPTTCKATATMRRTSKGHA